MTQLIICKCPGKVRSFYVICAFNAPATLKMLCYFELSLQIYLCKYIFKVFILLLVIITRPIFPLLVPQGCHVLYLYGLSWDSLRTAEVEKQIKLSNRHNYERNLCLLVQAQLVACKLNMIFFFKVNQTLVLFLLLPLNVIFLAWFSGSCNVFIKKKKNHPGFIMWKLERFCSWICSLSSSSLAFSIRRALVYVLSLLYTFASLIWSYF